MIRTYYRPIRKRPRPKLHKFEAIVSKMNDVCHDDHICADCMAGYAVEAEYNRPGHAWTVKDGKVVYMEDEILAHQLGRELKPTEGVLHKDGDVLNNRLSNLQVINIDDLETDNNA